MKLQLLSWAEGVRKPSSNSLQADSDAWLNFFLDMPFFFFFADTIEKDFKVSTAVGINAELKKSYN